MAISTREEFKQWLIKQGLSKEEIEQQLCLFDNEDMLLQTDEFGTSKEESD